MGGSDLFVTVDALAARVTDGMTVGVPRDHSGVPMETARALVRRGVRDLHLVTMTSAGLIADLLIGAGCIAVIETPGVSLGEYGPAPRFTNAVKKGLVRIKDSTCPAIHAALQAGEKNIPFMPLRGLLGSDLLRVRDDWKVIENPFGPGAGPGDPIVLLPAIRPDVALFHAAMADAQGNVHIGKRMELKTLAHAAKASLVTVERMYDGNLLDDDLLAAGTIPAMYVEAVAEARAGTWPCFFWEGARPDAEHMRRYARMARTDEGFAQYLDEFVFGRKAAA